MRRFTGNCELLCEVDIASAVAWIEGIKREDWPEYVWHKPPYIPYVLVDPNWEEFELRTDPIVQQIVALFPGCNAIKRALTTIHPGDFVPPHTDTLPPGWVTRIHVPLVSNPKAEFIVNDVVYHLEPGLAYQVNIDAPHAVKNGGDCSRIHFMFDIVEDCHGDTTTAV